MGLAYANPKRKSSKMKTLVRYPFLILAIILCSLSLASRYFSARALYLLPLLFVIGILFILTLSLSIGPISKMIFSKIQMDRFSMDMSLATLFILIFTLCYVFILPSVLPVNSYDMPFETKMWQSESGLKFDKNLVTPRQRMLGDLIKNILPGKTKAQISEALGAPDGTRFAHWADMVYVLGPQGGYGVDYEWLKIDLENDVFKDASVAFD